MYASRTRNTVHKIRSRRKSHTKINSCTAMLNVINPMNSQKFTDFDTKSKNSYLKIKNLKKLKNLAFQVFKNGSRPPWYRLNCCSVKLRTCSSQWASKLLSATAF